MAIENRTEQPIVTTQRAYTLRLGGLDKHDNTWRDRLWHTHEAVNKGAKAFGDWLLTMRGGLCHTLAEADVPGKGNKPARHPTPQEIRSRRIVLALSWLSVESQRGAPESHLVSHDLDMATGERKNWKTVEALRVILRGRSLCEEQIDQWANDCQDSLSAKIREDAVWVNRSKAFDLAANKIGASLTREELWDFLQPFFANKHDYLQMDTVAGVTNGDSETDAEEAKEDSSEEKAKDLSQKAGQWLSSRFGTGTGADFSRFSKVYEVLAARCGSVAVGVSGVEAIRIIAGTLADFSPGSNDIKGMLGLMSGPGYKSATRNILQKINTLQTVSQQDLDRLRKASEKDALQSKQKVGGKGSRPYANAILQDVEAACGICYAGTGESPARHWQYAVILDHAARRVSMAHSWIKRAEEQRGKFEIEKDKLDRVPKDALAWLDAFCARRSSESGASDAYRIRRSAVDGWKQVIVAWAALPPKPENQGSELLSDAESARIQAARELQDTVEKFGDIQLFEALSLTGAKCVWQPDGRPDAQPLLDYVAGTDAISKKQRFKVPAYRHPDALLHPVFCDFGNSRWSINYAIHRAPKKLTLAQQQLEKKKAKIDKAEQTLANAGDAAKQADIREKINGLCAVFTQQQENVAWLNSRHAMIMSLWDGTHIEDTPLIWQSKRFGSDIGQPVEAQPLPVSRADRFGRAVAMAEDNVPVVPSGLFDLSDWNGRLQAPRRQLEAIAAIRDSAKLSVNEKQQLVAKRIQSIRWLLTFSAKLQSHGPFIAYAAQHGFDWRYGAHGPENKSRQGLAKLILCRLPGLRILSVDLGHRYAAACAVWETLNAGQIQKACLDAGKAAPGPCTLYLHLKQIANGKEKKTIFRRIAADTLPDGSPHPAPWARLDRQFLIKLQGEDRDARLATSEEIAAVEQMENELGVVRQLKRKGRELLVDELMSDALRTLRLGLRRHGVRARIAFNLTANKRIRPGGKEEVLDQEGRVLLLTEILLAWYELYTAERWTDEHARELWNRHIQQLLGETILQNTVNQEDTPSAAKRRKLREETSGKLKHVAEQIAKNDSLCRQLHVLWSAQWQTEDVIWRTRLRMMRRWLLPRGVKRNAQLRISIRDVGGLSLTRIASFKSLYQVQKAYQMRPHPEDPRLNIPERGDSRLENFGQRVLDAMERMRENRVKQLASRIAEAALGIGDETGISSKDGSQKKRPTERSSDPRFAPCHAVVIEDLTHYRPDETQTRRENRQLMSWSSSKVKKYLGEACELNGLYLREVSPAFTSRQDSRTGAPGLRCNDVTRVEFNNSPFWRKQVGAAKKNQKERNKKERNKEDARERYLLSIEEEIRGAANDRDVFRIPVKGGEIFVSACITDAGNDAKKNAPSGLQADLNAAANIGLRAITDPDWEGRWWYIPCDAATLCPDQKKFIGCKAVDPTKPLRVVAKEGAMSASGIGSKTSGRKKNAATDGTRIVKLWRDPSGAPIHRDVLLSPEWQDYAGYWNEVQHRVIRNLKTCYEQVSQQEDPFVSQDADMPF
jgi:IS605 OrfB family transposase